MEIGRDYFGDDVMHLLPYKALEESIEAAHARFAADNPTDFASAYIFSFLQACIARASLGDGNVSVVGKAVTDSIRDLNRAIRAESWEVACCREVCHLTTYDGQPLDHGPLRVIPLTAPPHDHDRQAHRIIEQAIPGAAAAYSRDLLAAYAPPSSIVVVRDSGDEPSETAHTLSAMIEGFLFLVRVLYATTAESLYEVHGETTWVRRLSPALVRFRGGDGLVSSTRMIRRTARLTPADSQAIERLSRLLDRAQVDRPNMAMTSFSMAVHKFQVSFHAHAWWEQIVDLATALEALLSGKDKTDVLLRLRTRGAALLATESDPASAIFKDLGVIYDLRSRLVHGGELKDADLTRIVRSTSTVPEETLLGIGLARVVERLRDLVRRSLLARICLAVSDNGEPPWPLGTDDGVDAQLADDATRQAWRSTWRAALAALGAADAAEQPTLAVDFWSPEDN